MERFGFVEWPFANVPTPERGATLWADRANAREQMDAIQHDWRITRASTINLLWADLGAGKTHTLYQIADLCSQTDYLLPSYVLLPTAIRTFVELYRAIARDLNWALVAGALSPEANTWMVRNLRQALRWRLNDVDASRRNLAERWLHAERLRARDCEMIGVTGPITTVDDAVEALTHIVQAIAGPNQRMVLMIDEYQRVAEGSRRQLQEIGHGIHTLFNACPSGLGLILSCATGMATDYAAVLTPEIVSRLSQKRIDLPYLSAGDIVDYVRDLFAHYRTGSEVEPFFPLTAESTARFADYLVMTLNGVVTPRRVNEAFHELLSDADRQGIAAPIERDAVAEWIDTHGAQLAQTLAS